MTCKNGLSILVVSILAFSFGCTPLAGKPARPGSSADLPFCYAPFPAEPWESVHKIEATIQGRVFASLLGVTRGDPKEGGLHSFLLTPEGFILLEAEMRDGKIKTLKAVAPFDSPAFTSALMEDVRLLFLSPQGKPSAWGKGEDGIETCLWEGLDGARTQINGSREQGWRITRRDTRGEVIREASLNGPFAHGLAARMELRAFKPASYKLRLILLQPTP